MAKRNKKKTTDGGNSKSLPKKTATPENPKPEEKSAISVNAMYDEMPDEVADPGAVFKLAFLDMKRQEIINRLAIVAQQFEKQAVQFDKNRKLALDTVKAELREAEQKLKEHKDSIEAQYGLALKSYTYDDETGMLKKQALEEAEDEAKKASKTSDEGVEDAKTVH